VQNGFTLDGGKAMLNIAPGTVIALDFEIGYQEGSLKGQWECNYKNGNEAILFVIMGDTLTPRQRALLQNDGIFWFCRILSKTIEVKRRNLKIVFVSLVRQSSKKTPRFGVLPC